MDEPLTPQIEVRGVGEPYSAPLRISIALVTESPLEMDDPRSALRPMAEELSRRGHAVLILAGRRWGHPAAEKWGPVPVYRVFGPSWRGVPLAWPSEAALRRVLMENNVDLLHALDLGPSTNRVQGVARAMRLRTVLTAEAGPREIRPILPGIPPRWLREPRRIALYQKFDDILCPSLSVAQEFAQFAAGTQVHVIPNPPAPGRSVPSAAEEVSLLERIYLESFVAKAKPRGPRPRFAETVYHLDKRQTCVLCQQGTFETRVEHDVIPSAARRDERAYYTVWRCSVCRSIHSFPKVKDADQPERDPLTKRPVNPVNAFLLRNFLRFLLRAGVSRDARILFFGVNGDLFRAAADRMKFPFFEIHQGPLTPDALEKLPREDVDAVLVVDGLERADEPRLVMDLAARRLRPGGTLILHAAKAEGIRLRWELSLILSQPFRLHFFSRLVLESLARTRGFRLVRIYHRHCMDTAVPFLNHRAMSDLAFFGDGSMEDAYEFRWSRLIRKWWRLPRYIFLGVMGSVFPNRTNVVAFFTKQRAGPPAADGEPMSPSGPAALGRREVCTVCGRGRFEDASEVGDIPSNVWRFRGHKSTVWRCRECGCLHSLERVDLGYFYAHYPFGDRRLDGFARATFSRTLALLTQNGFRRTGTVLDYGCSAGLFLEYLRSCGIPNGRGYDRYVPRYADESVLKERYDAVVCQDVIEHDEDPRAVMETLARCVRPGGVLIVGTPRADAIRLGGDAASFHQLHQPYHVHILSEKALGDLGTQAGLRTVKIHRRHSCDTRVPFVNWRFFRAYLHLFDDNLDSAFDPPWIERVAQSPRLVFLGLFGSWLSDQRDMIAVFRKPAE